MADVSLRMVGKNLSRQALRQLQQDLNNTAKSLEDLADAEEEVEEQSKKTQDGLREVALGAGALAAAGTLLIRSWIGAATTMEKLRKGLRAVSKSAEETEQQVKALREVAKLPGLGFEEAVAGAISLEAVGMSAEMAQRSLMAFGNALATVGKGRAELQGVILALTQMSAKGKVMGDDLRQIANYLPQIRKAMMDAFGTAATKDLQDMGLSAEKFIEGIVKQFELLPAMTSGAANAIENLDDSMRMMKASLGEVLLPTMIEVMDTLSRMISWIEQLGDTQQSIIVWSTVTVTALASITAAAAALKAFVIPGLITGVKALGASLVWLATNPVGWAIIAVGALAAILITLKIRSRRAGEGLNELKTSLNGINDEVQKAKNIDTMVDRLEKLRAKTDKTAEESKELLKIQNDLADISPTLVKSFDNEGNAAAVAADKIRGYAKALRDSAGVERAAAIRQSKARLKEIEGDIAKAIKARDKARSLAATARKFEPRTLEDYTMVKTMAKLAEAEDKRHLAAAKRLRELKAEFKGLQDEINRATGKMPAAKVEEEKPKFDLAAWEKKQQKTLTTMTKREALLRAGMIEDEYDRKRAMAKAASDAELSTINERLKTLADMESKGMKIKEEVEAERAMMLRERAVIEGELAQKIKKINEDEEEAKRKETQKTADELEKLREDRLDAEEDLADKIAQLHAETRQDMIAAERALIATMEAGYDREMAAAYLAYRTVGDQLEEQAQQQEEQLAQASRSGRERAAIEGRLAAIRAKQYANQKGWELERDRITKQRLESEEEEEKQVQDAIFKSRIQAAKRATVALNSEQAERRAAVVFRYVEEEQRLKDALKDTEMDTRVREQLAAELVALQAAKIAELTAINEEFEDKRLKAVQVRNKLEEAAERKRRKELELTYDAWLDNEHMKIALFQEGLQQELSYIDLAYEERIRTIEAEMNAAETSAERKELLEKQLHLMRLQMAEEHRKAIIAEYEVIEGISQRLAAVPGDIIGLFQDVFAENEELTKRLEEAGRERYEAVRKIHSEEEMSAARKAYEIEKIEKASAQRRAAIEKQLAGDKADIFENYFKNFLLGIVKEFETSLQKDLAKRISEYISSLVAGEKAAEQPLAEQLGLVATSFAAAGQGGAPSVPTNGEGLPIGALMTAGVGLASGNPLALLGLLPHLFSFDNPTNDALARNYGRRVAMAAASFDNPTNDIRSRMAGTRMASYSLGVRSAKDMLDNFESGFVASAKSQSRETAGGNGELIDALKEVLSQPPQFQLIMDGREVHSRVQSLDDKRRRRGNAY